MKSKASTRHRRVLRRYSAEDRECILRQYHLSGQSKAAFCRDRQIHLTTFYGWLKRAPERTSGFAEITLKKGVPACSRRERIEMHLPGGARVFFPDEDFPSRTCRLIREVIRYGKGCAEC